MQGLELPSMQASLLPISRMFGVWTDKGQRSSEVRGGSRGSKGFTRLSQGKDEERNFQVPAPLAIDSNDLE